MSTPPQWPWPAEDGPGAPGGFARPASAPPAPYGSPPAGSAPPGAHRPGSPPSGTGPYGPARHGHPPPYTSGSLGTPAAPHYPPDDQATVRVAPLWHAGGPVPHKPSRRGRRGPWLVVAVAGIAVVGLVTALLLLTGVIGVDYFEMDAVSKGVATILTDDYGLKPRSVRCPERQKVVQGHEFQCTVVLDGRTRKVTITVVDEAIGAYTVSEPHD